MTPKILSVNTRSYPALIGGYTDVKVVLVAGEIGDYAAYAGCGPDEWVARHGNKITFEEACVHFPGGLERERYRD